MKKMTVEEEEAKYPMSIEEKFVAAFFGLVLAGGISLVAMFVMGLS